MYNTTIWPFPSAVTWWTRLTWALNRLLRALMMSSRCWALCSIWGSFSHWNSWGSLSTAMSSVLGMLGAEESDWSLTPHTFCTHLYGKPCWRTAVEKTSPLCLRIFKETMEFGEVRPVSPSVRQCKRAEPSRRGASVIVCSVRPVTEAHTAVKWGR